MSKNIIGNVLLDQYRVEAFVASGGMGTVYRVWDLKRNVSLAMKVLHTDLAEDPSVLKRFQREARALKKLTHPNIVPFYGLYQTADFFFLLEKYVDGPTLKEVLQDKRGPLAMDEALNYFTAISAALGFAHHNGVVHCDIKPGNVMVDRGGNIYLTDFGIARHAESTVTTFAGAGTPAYMAPEQIREQSVSSATDVYALGILLYEMLTGARPFRGDESVFEKQGTTSGERIRYAQLNADPPDPRRLNSSIPPELVAVIHKAMAKSPAERYQNAADMLDAVLKAEETRRQSPDGQAEFPEFVTNAPQKKESLSERFATSSNFINRWMRSRFSQITSTASTDGTPPALKPKNVQLSIRGRVWFLAPAGLIIVITLLFSLSSLYRNNKANIAVPFTGGSSVFSIDGTLYFTSNRERSIQIYKLVDGKAVQVTRTDGLTGSWGPILSRTGTLYFTSNREGYAEIYKLVDGKVVQVTRTSGPASSWGPIFSNLGTMYFTSNRNGKAEIYKLVDGKPVQVTRTNGRAGSWGPIFSNLGTMYFTSDRDGKPEIYKLVDGKPVQVTRTNGQAGSWGPIFSNLGTMYFTSDRDGKTEIYKLIAGRAVQVTRTNEGAKSWANVQGKNGWHPNYFTSSNSNITFSSSSAANYIAIWINNRSALLPSKFDNPPILNAFSLEIFLLI